MLSIFRIVCAGLGPTNKKTEKFSEFWQHLLTSANSTDFSNYVLIKNCGKKFAR
jgi:hypothetical protein